MDLKSKEQLKSIENKSDDNIFISKEIYDEILKERMEKY